MNDLSAKRIGYLRRAASASDSPVAAPSAATKAMWRTLSTRGLITTDDGGLTFKRTTAGEAALTQFDRTLSPAVRAVLNAIFARKGGIARMRGVSVAIEAGLISVDATGELYELSPAGIRLADPIGEEGYFVKSGNLVFVDAVCTEKGREGYLSVHRVDGDSAGKELIIRRDAFVRKSDWESYVGK